MTNLPITLKARTPENYLLTKSAVATGGGGLTPPTPLNLGSNVGGFHSEGASFAYDLLASRVACQGRVAENIFVGASRKVETTEYAGQDGPETVFAVAAEQVVGANTYPQYVAVGDRTECILRLWHDQALSQTTVLVFQLADYVVIPVRASVYAFDLWANWNTAPNGVVARVFNVSLL